MSSSIGRSTSTSHPLSGGAQRRILKASGIIVFCVGVACSRAPEGHNSNSAAGQGAKPAAAGNAEPRRESSPDANIDIKEPDRYTVAMTISAQASDNPSKMPTLQFGLSRLDADRRWGFNLPPPLGQVAYLEKSGLKYLIFFDRKQYVEVTPNDLGFQIPRALTPNALADQVKSRARFEDLGVEPVNGRTARKYRVSKAVDANTHAAGAIYLDQETGLPVRSEIDTSTSSNKNLRVIVEVRDIQLNPDRSLFDVPAGMKKLSTQDARQQIVSFSQNLRPFVEMTTGPQPSATPSATRTMGNRNSAASRR